MKARDLSNETDWKLKLRYGRLTTPFRHFLVIANGRVQASNSFDAPLGPAYMAMNVWASSGSEAAEMIEGIGRDLHFVCRGNIEVFVSEAQKPPREKPFGYGIRFTPYRDDQDPSE